MHSCFWQTEVIAAAAAGVAAEGLSPKDAKTEADNAAQLSVALVENAIVILMLVEDHLRLQSKQSFVSRSTEGSKSPMRNHLTSFITGSDLSLEVVDENTPLSSDPHGLPLDVSIISVPNKHKKTSMQCIVPISFVTRISMG